MDFVFLKENARWIVEVIAGLGLIALAHSLVASSIKRVSAKARCAAAKSLASKADVILLPPIKVLSFAVGGYFILRAAGGRLAETRFTSLATPILHATVIVCMASIALRWKKQLFAGLKSHPKMSSAAMSHTLDKILSMVIFILSALVILQVFKVDIWPLLAFGGIGAAAVGFAAKDVISNFCGGLMLSLTRPFIVGEQVNLPSLSIEGPVEEIGWYLTVIRDKDKRAVYLPNAIFSHAVVINHGRMSHRRIFEKLFLRFADVDKVVSITEKMRAYLAAHPSVDSQIPPLVYMHNFEDASLGIYLDVYVTKIPMQEFLSAKEEILIGIYRIIESQGAKIPNETLTVELERG